MSKFILFLALALAVLVNAGPVKQKAVEVSPSEPGTLKVADGGRIWIRSGGEVATEKTSGHWEVGVQVWDRFTFNNNLFTPGIDQQPWTGVECRYQVQVDHTYPDWLNCYMGFSVDETRTDAPHPTLAPGVELHVVTNVTTLIRRPASNPEPANQPRIRVLFQRQHFTRLEKNLMFQNALTVNIADPASYNTTYTQGSIAMIDFVQSFVIPYGSTDDARLLTLADRRTSNDARYIVENGIADFHNSGTDTKALQSYFNTGSLRGDPTFQTIELLGLNVTQEGATVVANTKIRIYNPHAKKQGNPFKFIISDQSYRGRLNMFGKFQCIQQIVTTSPFIQSRIFEGTVNPNITQICEYIQRDCTDQVEQPYWDERPSSPSSPAVPCKYPLASNSSKCSIKQYDSQQACETAVAARTIGFPSTSTGPTQFCVEFHTTIMLQYPAGHCVHVGEYEVGVSNPHIYNPCQAT